MRARHDRTRRGFDATTEKDGARLHHGSPKQLVILIAALGTICAAVVFSFHSALRGDAQMALVAGVMSLCFMGVLWVYLGILELRQSFFDQRDLLHQLKVRVGVLENMGELRPHDSQVILSERAELRDEAEEPAIDELSWLGDAATVEAGKTPPDVDSNGHSTKNGNASSSQNGHRAAPSSRFVEQNKAEETLEAILDDPQRPVGNVLRAEFAGLIRSGDFAAAISKGEEIVELFPESRMAREFEALRPYLEQRTGHAT